jgi:ribulose-bisphosphate carboxylase large chain
VNDPVRIEADYLIETAFDPREAALAMAGEQSSGTFVPVPGETPELKARAAARIEALEVLGEVEEPSLPGSGTPKGATTSVHRQARVTPGRSIISAPRYPT